MKQFLIILTTSLLIKSSGFSQSTSVIVPSNVKLPKDSTLAGSLLESFKGFLLAKEGPNNENKYVLQSNLLETSALLDEVKGIEKSGKYKDDHFYKCYLTNIVALDSLDFLIQWSYIGIKDEAPLLRASFTILAKKKGSRFYFYSPLRQRTKDWKEKKIGNTIIHYEDAFNPKTSKNYFSTISGYNKKLNVDKSTVHFYSCANYHEVLQLTGVDYKSDYNGRNTGALAASEKGIEMRIDGILFPLEGNFDPHDLWHSCLHKVVSTDSINRPVDEGTAYLYGGSWGYSWEEILEKFRIFANNSPDADWLQLYNESRNINQGEKNPLNVDFIINALIAREIENNNRIYDVLALVGCGKKEKGNENYFKTLEKITGINKENFNTRVNDLIKSKH